jgi:hypothetical protein
LAPGRNAPWRFLSAILGEFFVFKDFSSDFLDPVAQTSVDACNVVYTGSCKPD